MSLYDGLDYERDGLTLTIDKPKMDDPCTIEFGNLDEIPMEERCTPDQQRRFLYPECGNRVDDLVIPFKGVGQMTVKLQCMNELYGYLRDDQPLRYDISRGLWHRCPPNYFLCYRPREITLRNLESGVKSVFSYYGYDDMGKLDPKGQQVIKILTNPDVSADQAMKAFNSLDVKVDGKLVKVYGEGWLLDNNLLDVYQLLASNDLVQ